MKLYYSKGACSLVDRIIINEIGLPCEYESVNLKTKETGSGRDFLSINPKGAVPVLELDNGDILTENAIISQYLVESSAAPGLLPEVGDFKRYRVLEWLNYTTTELHKSFGPLFNQNVPQQLKDDVFIPLLKKKFNFVNTHLHNHRHLVGDHFTLPDAYMFVMILWALNLKFPLNEWPNLSRYFKELSSRKSIQDSLKEEGIERGL